MIGVYYYPEQWPEEQWQRDIEKIAKLGMRHIHLAEFSWIHLQPEEEIFNFTWLDKAIELAAACNLKVILCTPTAAPPVWMTSYFPEICMVKDTGNMVSHGSRAHRCVNSDKFIFFSEQITAEMGKRYGNHDAVMGWQIDNEIGHYGQTGCYCSSCRLKFVRYLKQKYRTIAELNRQWGCDFWSQNYQSFEQLELPNPLTLPFIPNEHAMLDFKRFYSLSLSGFLQDQSTLLRKHINSRMWITHNFMMNDSHHFPGHVKQSLDYYCMTIYPVSGNKTAEPKRELHRIGNPFEISLSHDQARSYNGRWGILEQQPGQVNWGSHNTRPYPGTTRLWLWTGLAHGAELLNTYRYRQPLSGAEQYHQGVTSLDGTTLSRGGEDFAKVAQELNELSEQLRQPIDNLSFQQKRIALCLDWDSLTALAIHPQSGDFFPYEVLRLFYQGCKRMGLAIDILFPHTIERLYEYELACVVLIDLADNKFTAKIQSFVDHGGHVILSPRNFSRLENGHFPEEKYGRRIEQLSGCTFHGYDVMVPESTGKIKLVAENKTIAWNIWSEQVEAPQECEIFAIHTDQFYQGSTVSFTTRRGSGRVSYIGFVEQEGILLLMQRYIGYTFAELLPLPPNTLFSQQGSLGIFMNYNDRPIPLPDQLLINGNLVLGEIKVPPADVAVVDYSG